MNKNKNQLIAVRGLIVMLISLAILLTACGGGIADTSIASSDTSTPAETPAQTTAPTQQPSQTEFFTFNDSLDRTVTLSDQPQRIIILSSEVLSAFDAIGGTVVGRADSPGIDPPAGAADAESVGQVSEVSLELILALQPDLVIGMTRFHRDLVPTLESSGIPSAMFQITTYDEITSVVEILGKLADREEEASGALAQLQERVDTVKSQLPDEQLTFANLNVTPNAISIQRTGTVGLDIANTLNMVNIAEHFDPDANSPTTVPYSLEKLVEQDPDYIFLIIHGSREVGQRKIETDMESNPAWNALTAVQEKRVIIVPSTLFLTNPGLQYDESLIYLSQYIYPDIFGEPEPEPEPEPAAPPASSGQGHGQ